MDKAKVSVIIPIYNVEKYIAECVESVQKQTLKEIEIICVNDGSLDNSMQIVGKMALKDKRIKIINKMNGGLSSARNAGFAEAGGAYVLFLDSDDYIVPETLEELYMQADEYDLDCLYFNAVAFFETEDVKARNIKYETYYTRNNNYPDIYDGMELFCEMSMNDDFRPSPCLQLIKCDVLKDNNVSFYNGIIHEDNLFSFQVMTLFRKVMYSEKVYYMRRVHDESIMTTNQPIRSAYGYYICITEISEMMTNRQFTRDEFINIKKFLGGLQAAALRELNGRIDYEEFFEVLEGHPTKHVMGLILWVYEIQKKIQTAGLTSREQNERIQNSISYKLGLLITYIPRKVYHLGNGIIRGLTGLLYIFYRIRLKASPSKICVSIIIPIYNAGKYIRECLDSLLCQTLRNIEIICVNDGSTDNSLEILTEYQQRDHRIIVINQENQGAGIARNNGMVHAKGEYLLFLDADDYFNPKLCDQAYYQARSKRAQICLFKADRVDMSSGRTEQMNWVLCEEDIPKKVFSAMDVSEKIFQITSSCPWSKLIEHKFIKENQLQFQNTKNANDVLFVRTACALSERITCVRDKALVTYRVNNDMSIQGNKSTAPLEFYKALKALKTELIKINKYSCFEKSFINMLLGDCLYNYKTAGSDDSRRVIQKALVEEIFPYFELEKYQKSDFYSEKNYELYERMIKSAEGSCAARQCDQ